MSVAQLLQHLHAGDAIIVADATRAPVTMAGRLFSDDESASPRDLLRNLIAVRKAGGKR